jgi:hypothetical protein
MRRWPFWLDLALKAALLAILLYAVLFPDSPQFEGKAMGGRAIAYPIAVDTLGDLTLGLSGSIVAAVVTAWLLWPRRAPQRERVSTTLSSPAPS